MHIFSSYTFKTSFFCQVHRNDMECTLKGSQREDSILTTALDTLAVQCEKKVKVVTFYFGGRRLKVSSHPTKSCLQLFLLEAVPYEERYITYNIFNFHKNSKSFGIFSYCRPLDIYYCYYFF